MAKEYRFKKGIKTAKIVEANSEEGINITDVMILDEQSTISNPPIGKIAIYARSGAVYQKDSSGVESAMSSSSTASKSTRIISAKSADYTVVNTDDFIVCTANTFTVTLYSVSGNSGKQIEIKNGGSGVITVKANGSELMDDLNSIPLYQYDALRIVCDGTKWHIV